MILSLGPRLCVIPCSCTYSSSSHHLVEASSFWPSWGAFWSRYRLSGTSDLLVGLPKSQTKAACHFSRVLVSENIPKKRQEIRMADVILPKKTLGKIWQASNTYPSVDAKDDEKHSSCKKEPITEIDLVSFRLRVVVLWKVFTALDRRQ